MLRVLVPTVCLDLLSSEEPFSSVLLPEHYSTHCHQCYARLSAPLPCKKCTQPRYCRYEPPRNDQNVLIIIGAEHATILHRQRLKSCWLLHYDHFDTET